MLITTINKLAQKIIKLQNKLNLKISSFNGFINKIDYLDKEDIKIMEKEITNKKHNLHNLIEELLIYNKEIIKN